MKVTEVTNSAKIKGKVVSKPKCSHEIEGEKFFEFSVEVQRLSEQTDVVPVTISERLLKEVKVGDDVLVEGEFRSYNKQDGEKSRLILTLFAKEFEVCEEFSNLNDIKLVGFLCKSPIYRKTPKEREICDVLLAVNRPSFRKSDYIPCIIWGRNARFVSELSVGSKVEMTGRIQSREYSKVLPDGSTQIHTAYEVSCQSVALLENSAQSPKVATLGE